MPIMWRICKLTRLINQHFLLTRSSTRAISLDYSNCKSYFYISLFKKIFLYFRIHIVFSCRTTSCHTTQQPHNMQQLLPIANHYIDSMCCKTNSGTSILKASHVYDLCLNRPLPLPVNGNHYWESPRGSQSYRPTASALTSFQSVRWRSSVSSRPAMHIIIQCEQSLCPMVDFLDMTSYNAYHNPSFKCSTTINSQLWIITCPFC
jgi:hypothetical protein